jgi:hypothetical protein
MSAPPPPKGQQTLEVRGTRVEGDNDRCLYVVALWQNDVIADRRDVDDFKEVSRTIKRTLSIRAWTYCCDFCGLFSLFSRSSRS